MPTASEVSQMQDFFRYSKNFPDRKGRWVWGGIDEGLSKAKEAESRPENLHHDARRLLCSLREQYEAVKKLEIRDKARSDGAIEASPTKLDRIAREIEMTEILLLSVQQRCQHQLQKDNISDELAAAVLEMIKFKFFARFGDYFAILNHEMKIDDSLSGLAFRKRDIESTQALVKLIDEEEEERKTNPAAETPILNSIEVAFTFVNDQFASPREIVAVFRAYAARNFLFHTGVKDLADEGDMHQLWQQLVRDREYLNSIPNLPDEVKYTGTVTLDAVAARFFDQISWTLDGAYVLSHLGLQKTENRIRKARTKAEERAKKSEERIQKEIIKRFEEADMNLERVSIKRGYDAASDMSEDFGEDALKSKIVELGESHEMALRALGDLKETNARVIENSKAAKEKYKQNLKDKDTVLAEREKQLAEKNEALRWMAGLNIILGISIMVLVTREVTRSRL